MGRDGFQWFIGVVEDRNDPQQIGRVRVRCLGYHTEDVIALPTVDLPWAHVMHPVTDPSMQGIGTTPSWLTPGSWVVGFWRDNEFQQPLIMGTLPGTPSDYSNPAEGFSDPRSEDSAQSDFIMSPIYGPYPGERDSGHDIGEPDTSRLARGKSSESHQSLIDRRTRRLRGDPAPATEPTDPNDKTGVPTATKPNLASVSDSSTIETRGFFEEPHPRGFASNIDPYISGAYPYNHVVETESGHIIEIDDSPGAERLYRQHRTGTFEEIHANGDRVTKVIGDNYEIVIGNGNCVIKGSQNITVEGSVRHLIKGDYILEVEGDFFRKIHGNERVKIGAKSDDNGNPIGGNLEEEIVGNHAYNIKDNVKGRVGGDRVVTTEKSSVDVIAGQYKLSVEGKKMDSNPNERGVHIKSSKDYLLDVNGNLSQSTISGIVSIKSGSTLNMKSANKMTVTSEHEFDLDSSRTMAMTSSTNIDIDSGGGSASATNSVNINNANPTTDGAARLNDTVDTGDDPAGISGSDGSNIIETSSLTVFIGD